MGQPAFPVPANETQRLRELGELGLADEPGSLGVEGVATVAAQACDRPWAGVSVVQEHQHRFLAVKGPFPSPSPREVAPCSWAIAQPEDVFEVQDFTAEQPFSGSPLVEEPGVSFYAGAVIDTPGGHGLGTVCVLDEEPGSLDPPEREALSILSDVVGLHLRLEHRTDQLERANEELDRFTTFVSHELTDPLSQVASNLDLLAMDLAEADEEVRELCEQALAGARRMDRMIKDLLRYGRASGRGLEPEPVDLQAMAEAARGDLVRGRGAPGTRVQVGDLPEVQADPGLLRRVVDNLVRNAFEHGQPPVHIGGEDAGDAWRIWVEDEGPGLSEDEQADLFDLFATGQASSGESTGVGLALCKRIVERHGGEIGVASEPGQGARFWFTVPKGSLSPAN